MLMSLGGNFLFVRCLGVIKDNQGQFFIKLLWEVETIHYEVQFGTRSLSQDSQGAFTVNIAILHVCIMCVYDSVKMHRLGFNYFELICQSIEFFVDGIGGIISGTDTLKIFDHKAEFLLQAIL